MFIGLLSIFAQFCIRYNMFIHSITYRKGKTMNLKTLISTTALAISANTFAVDLASKNTDSLPTYPQCHGSPELRRENFSN